MKKSYYDKGITLVALVVTIIVLLILSGITLSSVLSNDGLLSKAKLVKEKYENAKENEIIQLNSIDSQMYDVIKEPLKILSSSGLNSNYSYIANCEPIGKVYNAKFENNEFYVGSSYGQARAYIPNVDLSNFSQIHFRAKTSSSNSGLYYCRFFIYSQEPTNDNHTLRDVKKDVVSDQYDDYYIDVSEFNGSYYIGIEAWCNNSPYRDSTEEYFVKCNYIELIK